jgi:ribosomal protein L16 Arg81 hydroxylase
MSWIDWAIENTLNGVPRVELIDRMKQEGVAEADALAMTADLNRLSGYKVADKINEQYKKLSSVVGNLQALQEQDPQYETIEKIDFPSEEVFFKEYWTRNKPVIIKNFAKGWPAMSKWSLEYFADKFGDELVEVQTKRDADKTYELNSVAHKTKMPLSEFIAKIKASESSNDFYMTANNNTLKQTGLKKVLEDMGKLPEYLSKPEADGNTHLWIGPKGTVTPIHHDEVALFHVQIVGRKVWKLISPLYGPNMYNHIGVFSMMDVHNIDYNRFPKMRGVKIIEALVEPEEALFLPIAWWHGVVSLDRSISMSIINFKYPNAWTYNNPTGVYR